MDFWDDISQLLEGVQGHAVGENYVELNEEASTLRNKARDRHSFILKDIDTTWLGDHPVLTPHTQHAAVQMGDGPVITAKALMEREMHRRPEVIPSPSKYVMLGLF